MPHRISMVLALSGLLSLSVAASEGETANVVGEARDRDGQLVYREFHFYSDQGNRHRVIYRDPAGRVIAEKSLDYARSRLRPSLQQSNNWCGESISVAHLDEGQALAVQYSVDGSSREAEIESGGDLVVDAGFDHFVRENWEALESGREELDYLVPSRLAHYAFRVRPVDCADGERCFAIEPARWWMRMLSNPIRLRYDVESKRLLGFEGLGNIADENCDYLDVEIDYRYPASPEVSSVTAASRRALASD